MLRRLLTREKLAEAALFGIVEAAVVAAAVWLAGLISGSQAVRDWAIVAAVPAGLIAGAIGLHAYWGRRPPAAIAQDAPPSAALPDDQLAEYEAMKAQQALDGFRAAMENLYRAGQGLITDYEAGAPPLAHLPELEARALVRVDEWEENILRFLEAEDAATFTREMPEEIRLHPEWHRRVTHYVEIKLDRLRRIRDRRIGP